MRIIVQCLCEISIQNLFVSLEKPTPRDKYLFLAGGIIAAPRLMRIIVQCLCEISIQNLFVSLEKPTPI